MTRNQSIILVAIVFVLGITAANTLFVVDQTHEALVVRLGEPVRTINAPGEDAPGLQVKLPFVENVMMFDRRILDLEIAKEEVTTSNQERLVVDAFARYRIKDPLQFYRTLRTETLAETQLQQLVTSSLREQLGSATTTQIISQQRAAIMTRTRDDVARRAAASKFGIQIVDIRIKRADLPEANEEAVYKRMQTQRAQEAQQIRATGDQQQVEIIATATKQAEDIRGQGDAERARIFADSFGKDPNFAAFYRSMAAYESALGQGDATLVLSPDSDFFKYFSGGPSK